MESAAGADNVFDFFEHVELPAPAVPPQELADAFKARFGLELALTPLGSQQDQNFLARDNVSGETIATLKVSNPAFSEAEIELQNEVSSLLARTCPELRVARSLEVDGRYAQGWLDTSQGRLHARLIEFVPGDTLTGDRHLSPAVVARFGELAGKVSRALEFIEHPAIERTLQWDLQHAERVITTLSESEADPIVREAVLDGSREALNILSTVAGSLPMQVGHFDLADDNLVIAPGESLPDGIIDFGDTMRSWAVAELAVPISSVLHHAGASPISTLPAIKAFHALRPLSEVEVTALWPLVVLRAAVLVLSGRSQANIDPSNTYAASALDRERRIFEQSISTPLEVITEQIRVALGQQHTATSPGRISALLKPSKAVWALDAGPRSPLNNDGRWLSGGTLDAEARAILDQGRAEVVILPFRHAVLTGSPALTPYEPSTLTTGITAWFASDETLVAPFEGSVAQLEGAVELRRDGLVLRLRAPRIGVTADRVVAGAPFVHIESRIPIEVQLIRGSRQIPQRVPVSYSDGWLAQVADPSPLFGITPKPAERKPSLLARRERVLAEVQEHYYELPPQIERGWQEHLIDVHGRVYLDMVNNVTSVGHAHPRVARAAAEQLQLLNTNSRFNYEAITSFAEKITATLPDELDTVFFVNSGSEATDLAIRIAMAATGRRDLVAMRESYHGWTFASDAVSTSIADNPNALGTRPEWVHTVDAANSYRGKHRGAEASAYAAEAVEDIAKIAGSSPIAGFISESYFGNAGGVAFPDGYLKAVYAAVRTAGGVTIADEVQVGYGRLGEWFWGFQQQGVIPDIVAVAKSIGNGTPVGAVITRKEIADRYRTQGYFFSSTGGSPVSSVVGSTVLDIIIDEGLQENARVVGGHLKRRLEALVEKHPLLGAVHGSGLYLGAEFVRDRDTLEPATEETAAICDRLLTLGIIMQPTGDFQNVLKIKPPLCIKQESVDFFADTLDQVLTEGT